MKMGKLADVTAKEIKSWYEWLQKEQMGCSSICFASDAKYNWVVCMGWLQTGSGEDGYEIAWKIGRQTHNNVMQCDFEIDFEMPYNEETGDCEDTCTVIHVKPKNLLEWSHMAGTMRELAKRVYNEWKVEEEEDGE